jgi:hypothetical protein
MVTDEFLGVSKTLTLFLNLNLRSDLNDPKNMIIVRLGGKFPGCGLLLFQNEKGKLHLSLYQPKYNGSGTTFEKRDYNKTLKVVRKDWGVHGFQSHSRQEFHGVVLTSIALTINILGEVANSLEQYLPGVTLRGLSALEEFYGPTLFPLLRPSHTDQVPAKIPKKRGRPPKEDK